MFARRRTCHGIDADEDFDELTTRNIASNELARSAGTNHIDYLGTAYESVLFGCEPS